MGRQHSTDIIKYPYVWLFAFPVMLLLVAQTPLLMKCDQCDHTMQRRSAWGLISLVALIYVIGIYVWILFTMIATTLSGRSDSGHVYRPYTVPKAPDHH